MTCFFAIFFFTALLLAEKSFSQTTSYHRYIIEFTDKNNSPFSVNNPSAFLSQRAIDRRNRYDIQITETDLPINPNYIQQVLATGVKLLNRSKWLNSISIQTEDSLALAAIRDLPFVKSSNPIAFRTSGPSVVQNQKWNAQQSENSALKTEGFNPRDYGNAFHQINMLHGDDLHERGFLGQGMIIAQLDGGWYNMPLLDVFDSLRNDGRLLGVWNFVDQNDTVYNFATHGTEVLAFMAANKPGEMIGTAPKASFYLFLTEDVFSEFPIEEHNWAAAAEIADSLGADIISSSLGYTQFDDPTLDHTYADMNGHTCMSSRAAMIAASKGMIVCSSAGNSGESPWYYISAPADADSIITVGATDSTGTITAFSSHGPTSDGRVKPDVVAQGIRAWTIDPVPGAGTFPGNGTSFSNPIIAGLTACLWQAHPDKNNFQIIEAIKESASLFESPNDSMGYGIPDFRLANLFLSGNAPHPGSLPFVYPNPFSTEFDIVYSEIAPQDVIVTIMDVLGRKDSEFDYELHPDPSGYFYIPISYLEHAASGLYFVCVQFHDHTDLIRVMKNQP